MQAHTDAIQSIAISPDGKIIASASDDGTVRLWELEADNDKASREIKDQGGWVRAVVFLSDRQIITAGQDKNIKIIDVASGQVVKTFVGHTNLVNSLAIAPAIDLLVSGSFDNTVNVWQISTGKLQRSLKGDNGHTDKIWGVAISPDGKQIVSASRDKTLKIWDVKTGELLRTLTGSLAGVTCVLVTPDGKRVISGSGDKVIRVWDMASGKQIFILTGHEDAIAALAITNDGNYLFSGGKDSPSSIRIWNLRTKSLIWNLIGHTDLVTSLAITPDQLKLISSSQAQSIPLLKSVIQPSKFFTFATK